MDYYADPDAPITTKRDRRRWKKVQDDLALLKQMKASGAVEDAMFH